MKTMKDMMNNMGDKMTGSGSMASGQFAEMMGGEKFPGQFTGETEMNTGGMKDQSGSMNVVGPDGVKSKDLCS
jgi:hypothetical protein